MILILHSSMTVLVCLNGAYLSPTSPFKPISQKGCSLLYMQISSNFYTALQVSEDSTVILPHLNVMTERKWSAGNVYECLSEQT